MEVFNYLVYFLSPLITFIVVYLYCSYKQNYWTRSGVIQLKNTSKVFGDFKNGVLFRTGPGLLFGQLYKSAPTDAPFVGIYIFHKPCLLLRDPQIIKQVLVSDFKIFTNRHFAGRQQKDSIGMTNLFGVREPAWSYLRKKLSPTLSGRGKMKQTLPFMIESAKPMMEYLSKMTGSGNLQAIDIQDVSYKFASDLIANLALGAKTDCFECPDSYYCKFLMDFFYSFKRMVALVTVFFMPELVDMIGSLFLFDSSYIRKVFWKAVESREISDEKRGDYIDEVIQLKNGQQDPVYKFEGDNVVYQCGTLLSGFESSAIATTFLLMELAKNKEYQDLARKDIKEAIAKHGWTVEAFDQMKYLGQCLSESLRLHPAVSTLDRYPTKDYQVISFNRAQLGQLHVKVAVAMILSEYELSQNSQEVKMDHRSTLTAAADGIHVEFNKLSSSD
ncbi:hypothetical protein ABMA27_012770 [Loxostege sticticalis]|uniref:unspecific monooxygenase n=1 Tax=Loxostege sticticalis TaxID=481309 RepID=A0ABR3H0G4_LOXSC